MLPSFAPPTLHTGRLLWLALVPCLASGAILFRLAQLQTFGGEKHRARAEAQHFRTITFPELRGRILDENRHELASSAFSETLFIRPDRLFSREAESPAAAEVVSNLASALGIEEDDLLDALETTRAVVIKKRMGPTMGRAVREVLTSATRTRLNRRGETLVSGSGWWINKESIRSYTKGDFSPHVIGYTVPSAKGDAAGMDGLEKTYDSVLNATTATERIRKTALGTPLTPARPQVIEDSFGRTIVVTLNNTIQRTAEQVLAEQVQTFRAESGVCVVVEVATGAILAMANVPTYDLNSRPGTTDLHRRNRAIADGFEPGSVMKTFNYLAALEEGKLSSKSIVDCGGGSAVIRGRPITDAGRRHGAVPAAVAFADSSNVGAVRVTERLTQKALYDRLRLMGFGTKSGIDLPGETGGLLYPTQRWSSQSQISLAFGYEMRATALQLAMAGAAIGNDGHLMRPFLVREIQDHTGTVTTQTQPVIRAQIASPRACRDLMEMMALTVLEGTGRAARLDGWTAAGKTGTTKLVDPATRRYSSNLYMSSFLGLAPLEKPEVAIYVSIRRPDPSIGSGGGAVAAPVFKVVAESAMRALRVPPSPGAGRPGVDPLAARQKILRELQGRVPADLLEAIQRDEDAEAAAIEQAGVMPDFSGLSLRDVAQRLAQRNWTFEVDGTGVVAEHWPRPHESLAPGEALHVRLRLAPVSQRLKELAEAAAPALALPQPGRILLAQAPLPAPTGQIEPEEDPVLRLRRGNSQLQLTLAPVADTAVTSRLARKARQIEEFPAGQPATRAAELPPPTPGLSAKVWAEYWSAQEFAEAAAPAAATDPNP